MAGKLTFSIAINLLTEQFKRNANQVKAAFRSIQMQVLSMAAALGAGGLGFAELISRMKDTAKETSRVQTALKNVSDGAAGYASNVQFLAEMSRKYGLEINNTTAAFAKFTAAASAAGMPMQEQRKIFESMSRAVTAFGLSADDSNGVFLALSQMMSKGKISSEELRLQMGERLPIAMQAMAKAAGTTVAGLDDLLKAGKLMSADVLPKFADALNEMLPNVDTDNLSTSLNKLSNTFTSLVQKLDVAGKYKSVVDTLNTLLSKVRDNIAGLVAFVITMISGKLLDSIRAFVLKVDSSLQASVANAERCEAQKLQATEARIAAEKRLEVAKTAWENAEQAKQLQAYTAYQKAQANLKKAIEAEKRAATAATAASEQAAAARSVTSIGRVKNVAIGTLATIGKSLKGLLSTLWPVALLSAVSAFVSYLVSARQEANRIKNIFADYKKEMEAAGTTAEVSKMQKLQEIMNDRNRTQNEINAAQAELQKMLGTEKLTQQQLNDKVNERIELLKEAARAELAASKIASTEDKQRAIQQSTGLSDQQITSLYQLYSAAKGGGWRGRSERYDEYYGVTRDFMESSGRKYNISVQNQVDKALEEYIQNQKVLNDATDTLAKSQANAAKLQNKKVVTGGGIEETELQKQQEKYAQALRELEAKRKVEGMTVDQYNKELASLTRSSLIGALSSKDKSVSGSAWAKDLAEQYKQAMLEVTAATTREILDQIEQAVSTEDIRAEAAPVLGKRDTTFDYKKSQSDILAEELDIWREYQRQLQEEVSNGVTSLADDLNNAMQNVTSLEDALKIAQVQEDIDNLKKSLNEGIYSGIKDIASSSDRIVSAFESLDEVMNDADATEWEKIMAVFNAIVNTIDGISSVIKTIENLSEIVTQLSGAEQSSESIVAGKIAEAAANQVATEMEIAASKRKTEAAITEMAAKSTSAYAGIPFAGAGLAAAQIAAMIALIEGAKANIPAFREGGIVAGGPSAGDRILTRLNAGEMVLTTAQQSRLFSLLETGGVNAPSRLESSVTTKIRAKDLILAINNELKSQGKKTL